MAKMTRSQTAKTGMMPATHVPGVGHHRLCGGPFDQSVSRSAGWAEAKAQLLGGSMCKPKTEVPGMGSFAICGDMEGNVFGLWEPLQRNT